MVVTTMIRHSLRLRSCSSVLRLRVPLNVPVASLPLPLPVSTCLLASSFSSSRNASSSSSLLTLATATAKQLKGDIAEAIDLTNQALTQQRHEDDSRGVAETALFLGKLLQLEQRFGEAEASFREAHSLQRSLSPHSRDEYTALSHLAHAQKKMHHYKDAESNYLKALSGLEETVGWEDGATNHTSFELAKLYRERGRKDEAASTLDSMRGQLAKVFGEEDPRALQINGELAELRLSLGDRCTAISLLDDVVERLPPNSPEARRIFMRLEELKEQEEAGEACSGEIDVGGIVVTATKAKGKS